MFDRLRVDVMGGVLPSVSWICAPEAYSEHPHWPANYGAWYTSKVLNILSSNPAARSRTAFFIMFDENDGYFDHIPPPTPPATSAEGLSMVPTELDFFAGKGDLPPAPYGLGPRVPMLVISPWSKGGWVNSEVSDHTSLIRFVERRFADEHPQIVEPHITPWRRAVAGDLTSAFDFKDPNRTRLRLPLTRAYEPPDHKRHQAYKPQPPALQKVPAQEPGVRPARAVLYQLETFGIFENEQQLIRLTFRNEGRAGAVFQVRSAMPEDGVRSYTLTPGAELSNTWHAQSEGPLRYDLHVYGSNGFYRGLVSDPGVAVEHEPEVQVTYEPAALALVLHLKNNGSKPLVLTLEDRYTHSSRTVRLHSEEHKQQRWHASAMYGWYDLELTSSGSQTFRRHLAGHIENGLPSFSDPALGQQNSTT